ncbi:hypothetical protein GCM10023347_44320 [Streptomyces chumphonensis]
MYNAATLAISLLALVVSSLAVWRQIRNARSAGAFATVLEVYLRDVRDKDYQRDQSYVLSRLAVEHPPADGIRNLPDDAQHAVWNVAFLYESLGMMYVLGNMDRRIALGTFNFRIVQVWEALEPYVVAERAARLSPFLAFFEHLYLEARSTSPVDLYRKAGLRHRDGFVPDRAPSVGPEATARADDEHGAVPG